MCSSWDRRLEKERPTPECVCVDLCAEEPLQTSITPGPQTRFVPGCYYFSDRFRPTHPPQGHVEELAHAAYGVNKITWEQLQRLFDLLPADDPKRKFQHECDDRHALPAKMFTVGGYIHGPWSGLRKQTAQFPWLCSMLTGIVRHVYPSLRFTTITLLRNVQSNMHCDSHNDASTYNIVLPFSKYDGGELWVEHSCGNLRLQMNGPKGYAHSTQVPLIFQPKHKHATMPWTLQRYCMVAFHVRNAERIDTKDMRVLLDQGFMPLESACYFRDDTDDISP